MRKDWAKAKREAAKAGWELNCGGAVNAEFGRWSESHLTAPQGGVLF